MKKVASASTNAEPAIVVGGALLVFGGKPAASGPRTPGYLRLINLGVTGAIWLLLGITPAALIHLRYRGSLEQRIMAALSALVWIGCMAFAVGQTIVFCGLSCLAISTAA